MFIGSDPQTQLVKGMNLPLDDGGYIETNQRMETPVPGLYAVGDVRASPFRQLVVAAGEGAIAAHAAGQYIDEMRGEKYFAHRGFGRSVSKGDGCWAIKCELSEQQPGCGFSRRTLFERRLDIREPTTRFTVQALGCTGHVSRALSEQLVGPHPGNSRQVVCSTSPHRAAQTGPPIPPTRKRSPRPAPPHVSAPSLRDLQPTEHTTDNARNLSISK